MRKSFFLFICTLVLCASSFSQCGYYFQRMIGNYRFVRFWDDRHGVLLGDNGFMLTTEDGGTSWKEQMIPLFESLMRKPTRSISLTGGSHGYIVGSFGNILKTTDKGKTWTRLVGITGEEEFSGVHFVNTQLGYVCGYEGVLYKTTDGGNHWQSSNLPFTDDYYGICFSTTEKGYVWGRNRVLQTANGGKTWEDAKSLPGTNIGKMQFVSASNGFVTFSDQPGKMYKTIDGGTTWTLAMQHHTVFTGFHFSTPNTFYSGEYGSVEKHVNWAVAKGGVGIGNFYVSDVFFPTENTGFITGVPSGWSNGNGRCLLKTTNGGQSWEKLDYVLLYPNSSSSSGIGVADFMKVNDHKYLISTSSGQVLTANASFGPWLPDTTLSNASNYLKIGHKGKDFIAFYDNKNLFTSADDGKTWIQKSLNLPDSAYFNTIMETIAWISKDTFYATAYRHLLYTANGGTSWSNVNVPSNLWIRGSRFFSKDTGYMTARDSTYQPVMYRTYDAGSNWKKINPWDTVRNGDYFKANYINDSVFIVVVGYNRDVYKTRDRGNTWEKMNYHNGQQPIGIYELRFFNEQVGAIITGNYEVFTTRDTGKTWLLQVVSLLNHEGMRGIHYASESEMYVRGDYLNLFRFTPYQPQKPSMISGDTVVLEGTSHEYIIPLDLYAYDSKWSVSAGSHQLLYDSATPERVQIKWATPGNYRLDVYSKNECGIGEIQSLQVKVKSPTEPDEPDVSTENEFCKIFPNPVTNQILHIQFEQTTQLEDIQLYNATGSLLKQTGKRFISSLDIPMDQYPSGIYFLKVIPLNKQLKPVVKKIIK